MFGGGDDAAGVFTSGGTESILTARKRFGNNKFFMTSDWLGGERL